MDTNANNFVSDPYKTFFPLGTLLALIGGGIWFFSGSEHYPVVFHSQAMIGAFLFSFISGFLMTAIPNMTGSFAARKFEVNGMLALIIISVILNILEWNQLFYFIELLSYLLLIYFAAVRVHFKKAFPPSFFVLIFLGMLSGIIGSFLLGTGLLEPIGHNLYFNGVILFLVLGVGSRLVPALRGVMPKMDGGAKKEYIEFGITGLIIFVSLVGEAVGNVLIFGLLKSSACLFLAIRYWKIFSFTRPTGRLAYGMWGAAYMVLLGIILKTLMPDYATHWIHLTYISGFGMMTFTVASRVIISHGRFNMIFEKKSITPILVVLLLSLSALIRVAAPYFDYALLLKWASAIWIIGTLIWGYVFIPRCVGMISNN